MRKVIAVVATMSCYGLAGISLAQVGGTVNGNVANQGALAPRTAASDTGIPAATPNGSNSTDRPGANIDINTPQGRVGVDANRAGAGVGINSDRNPNSNLHIDAGRPNGAANSSDPSDNRWRFQRYNNEWWYWTPRQGARDITQGARQDVRDMRQDVRQNRPNLRQDNRDLRQDTRRDLQESSTLSVTIGGALTHGASPPSTEPGGSSK